MKRKGVPNLLCLIAKLDDAASAKLNAIRKAAFPDGGQGKQVYGHITLASYPGERETAFVRSCRELLAEIPAFEITYESLVILQETHIIVAKPMDSEILTMLHRRIAEKHGDDLDPWTKGDRWYPHTTLFYGPGENLEQIRSVMTRHFSPIRAKVVRFELSRVLPDGYEIVDRIALLPC